MTEVWWQEADVEAPAENANCAMLLATAYMPLMNKIERLPAIAQQRVVHRTYRPPPQAEMMFDAPLPESDLALLAEQVLSQPSAAALPFNLSDEWLALIARDLDCDLAADDNEAPSLAAPLALVIHILADLHKDTAQFVSNEDLESHLRDYQIEIALELVRRKTAIQTDPATMETIFKPRTVVATDRGAST